MKRTVEIIGGPLDGATCSVGVFSAILAHEPIWPAKCRVHRVVHVYTVGGDRATYWGLGTIDSGENAVEWIDYEAFTGTTPEG